MSCASLHFINDHRSTNLRLPIYKKRFKSNPPHNKDAWQAIIRSKLQIKQKIVLLNVIPIKPCVHKMVKHTLKILHTLKIFDVCLSILWTLGVKDYDEWAQSFQLMLK